jgi:hypothetical protein
MQYAVTDVEGRIRLSRDGPPSGILSPVNKYRELRRRPVSKPQIVSFRPLVSPRTGPTRCEQNEHLRVSALRLGDAV